MAGEFFGGLGQAFVGGLGCIATLGLNDDVKRWTEEGGSKIERSAEKAWGKDGEVTQFFESMPGMETKKLHENRLKNCIT